MKNYPSDFSSKPKFTRYYGLDNFPEAYFLIEAECFDTSVDTTNKPKSSAKGILFALGIIVTLVVLSGFQLYRSVETIQPHSEISKSKKSVSKQILNPASHLPTISKVAIDICDRCGELRNDDAEVIFEREINLGLLHKSPNFASKL